MDAKQFDDQMAVLHIIAENEALRKQLAECQRERDELIAALEGIAKSSLVAIIKCKQGDKS